MFLTSLKQTCSEYLIKFSENQSAPKLEKGKTSPCSPCAPNLPHVLLSRIPGYHNLCSPGIALLFSFSSTLIVGCISFMSGNEKENKDWKENTFSFCWKFKWRQQLLPLYIGTFQLGKLLTSSFREGLKKMETWVFFLGQKRGSV